MSIKTTTVKPSGTVSLLAGATPGVHYPHSEYYIRRVRFGKDDPIVSYLSKRGYTVEEDFYSTGSMVISFPMKEENFSRAKADVSVWEQLELVANMQAYWADNAVSCTVTVKESEKADMYKVLEYYETKLKTVSFLPLKDHGYKQPPYEEITEEQYKEMTSKLKDINYKQFDKIEHQEVKFCDGEQ